MTSRSMLSLLVALCLTHQILACCASAYNVTDLSITAYTGHGNLTQYNNTILFVVHDPDPATDATTICGQQWPASASPYTDWMLCQDESFQWRFGDYEDEVSGYINHTYFGISVEHVFEDPSMGPPPYDYRDTFGRAQVQKSMLNCRSSPKGRRDCAFKLKYHVLDVPIYAET